MVDVFAVLAVFDATQPDGLLVALAGAPGVDAGSITTRSNPRGGGHGHHAVTWSQNGRTRTEEGNTLAAALRRAVRASGARSATATTARTVPADGPGRSVFREAV